jgi:hypothetical protein
LQALGAALLGVAGGTYAARKSNKYSSQAFGQRMQDAEKYGIHPLQALGGNANFQGTGGANVGNIINQSKQLKKAQQYQDSVREDVQDHEQNMQLIKDQAENQRLTRRLEAEAKSPLAGDNIMDLKNKFGNYWGPGYRALVDTFTDAGDGVERWIQGVQDDYWKNRNQKNLTFKDR